MIEPITYHSDRGYRTGAIVSRGPKFLGVVLIKKPVRIHRIPVSEGEFMKPLMKNGAPYPPRRMAKKLRDAGKRFGITKAAKQALRGVR